MYLIDVSLTKYDRVILENAGTLIFVPDYYKNQKMVTKAVDNYPRAIEFVPDCFKTRKTCNIAVDS